MIEINPLDDIMNYFGMIFVAYISLFIVVVINFLKSIYLKRKGTFKNIKGIMFIDLIINLICGLSMLCGLMFMGVLAYNNANNWSYWDTWLWFISASSLTIFIIHIIIVATKKKV